MSDTLSDALSQAAAWQRVIHGLHVFQAALDGFRAALSRLDRPLVAPADAPELLPEWLACQSALDDLPDAPGEGLSASARLALVRREMEEYLRGDRWSVAGLRGCAAELGQTCAAALAAADRELRRALAATQHAVEEQVP